MSNVFSSNFKNRNRDHFASIVRVALSDDIITDDERKFINRLAILLEIEPAEADEIILNPDSHQINPPASELKRLERLYDLSRIVVADDAVEDDNQEISLTEAHKIEPDFEEEANSIVEKSIKLVQSGADEDDFILSLNQSKGSFLLE